MLPGNVILRELADGVEVSAVDPVSSMAGIGNPERMAIAGGVRDRLSVVVEAIQ